MNTKSNYAIIIFLSIGVLLIVLLSLVSVKIITTSHKQLELSRQIATDSLRRTTDALGREIATRKTLESSRKDLLAALDNQDSTIIALKQLVRSERRAKAALIAQVSTVDSGTVETVYVMESDTITKDSIVYVYPRYVSEWAEEWSAGKIVASKDSISRDITHYDKYEVMERYVPNGLLRPGYYEVSWKSLNPNTQVIDMQYWRKEERIRRWSIGFQVGGGVSHLGRPIGYIGLGISRNFVSF